MDAIEKAVAKYRVAVAEHQAAGARLTEAKAELAGLLGLGAVADSSTSSEAAKPATPPPVKPPAKPAPKPKATAAPAPKAAPKPAPAATTAPWTTALAKKLLGEIGGWSVVLREVAAAGGSVPVDKVPRADGDGVMGVASVGAFLSSVRAKARNAGIDLPIASERARVVSLDPALCAVLREMGGVP